VSVLFCDLVGFTAASEQGAGPLAAGAHRPGDEPDTERSYQALKRGHTLL
jgi:hypothetical protein